MRGGRWWWSMHAATTQGPSIPQLKIIFGRSCQLFAINAHKMVPRTSKRLQERAWDTSTKGLLWNAFQNGARVFTALSPPRRPIRSAQQGERGSKGGGGEGQRERKRVVFQGGVACDDRSALVQEAPVAHAPQVLVMQRQNLPPEGDTRDTSSFTTYWSKST